MEIVIQVNKQLGKITAYDDRNAKTYTIEELQSLALTGDAEAQKAMGDYFYEMKNPVETVAWLKKAADNGHAKAQWHLGVRYFAGADVEKDLDQSEYWFKKAAEQGDVDAEYGLSGCYVAKQDFENALHWLKKAAAQGHADAMEMLKAFSPMLSSN